MTAAAPPGAGHAPRDPVGLHGDRRRAESFGGESERYERTRPSPPDELVTELTAAGPATVLEVGCGTGKAGRLLAARGCEVLGVEPDPRIARIAAVRDPRRGRDVRGVAPPGADLRPGDRGPGVALGRSGAGAIKARAVLRPSGRRALFWNIYRHEPAMRAALDGVYARLAPEFLGPESPTRGRTADESGRAYLGAIEASDRFEPPEHHQFASARRYTTDEWLDGLSAFSDHAQLSPERLTAVLDVVRGVIDDHGGVVDVRLATHLVSARAR